MLPLAAHPIVHVNASLNTLATILLVVGFVLIKRRHEVAHKRVMLSALVVSILFLACYLYYHFVERLQTPFEGEGAVRYVYFAILISHVLLAITVPPLALVTILFGLRAHGEWLPKRLQAAAEDERLEYAKQYRTRHRRWARVTFPIWLYVSITGVLVYLMLYHLWPSAGS